MGAVLTRIALIITQCLGYLFMAFHVDRTEFSELLLGFTFLFIGLLIFMRHWRIFRWTDVFWTALLFRAVFLFSEPPLSDDFYRFMWDGTLVAHGAEVYTNSPSDLMSSNQASDLGLADLYPFLNSPDYYTVYPPLEQVFFASAVWLGRGDLGAIIFFLHLIIMLFEGVFIYIMLQLLRHFSLPAALAMGYAFNPLVIIELTGNLHFEGVVLSFLAMAVWCWIKAAVSRPLLWKSFSAVAFALAVSVKLTPIMLAPLLICLLRRQSIAFGIMATSIFLLTLMPFYSPELLEHWHSSLALYFRTFEFNASLYYLVRAIGSWSLGYNPIATVGPAMSIVTLLLILFIAARNLWHPKSSGLVDRLAKVAGSVKWTYLVYYLMATTVHPWYITTLVAFAVFTPRREAWWWSFLVVFSYAHYEGGGYAENYHWIIAEYSLLALAILLPQHIVQGFVQKVLNGFPMLKQTA